VLFDARCAEHDDVFVTGAAGDRVGLAELVRTVAAHALGVPIGEQRRRRHDRLFLGVTLGAGSARGRRRRMLVLMARRADRGRRLSFRRVRGLDSGVTLRARRRSRSLLRVRAVTLHALALGMNLDSGCLSLVLQVAATAVASDVRARVGLCERVAGGAVRLGVLSEPLARVRRGVLDPRLLLVALLAALRSDRSERGLRQLVALRARNLFAHDVNFVSGQLARPLPGRTDVNATTVGPCVTFGRTMIGASGQERSQNHCAREANREKVTRGADQDGASYAKVRSACP
jgi:hypothetical protein